MSRIRPQKARELGYFYQFAQLLAKCGQALPSTKPANAERPDFLVQTDQRTLGIEVTELRKPKSPAAKYSALQETGFRDKLVSEAKRLCNEWGVKPLSVEVRFHSLSRLSGRHAQRQLTQRVASYVRDWSETRPHESYTCLMPDERIPEVFQIFVIRGNTDGTTGPSRHDWSCAEAATPRILSVDALQGRLDAKNRDYGECRKKCDECWLLIVADPYDVAMAFDIERAPEVRNHRFAAQSDRVFYLQLTNTLVELQICRQD